MSTISRIFGAALLVGVAVAASGGCEFVSAVDRNQIPGAAGTGGGNQGGGGANQGGGGANQGGGGSGPTGCSNGVMDGSETDVDCGGADCSGCAIGQMCGGDSDCDSGKCVSDVCAERLLISEVRSRGPAGADDEFVEIFNPSSVEVTTGPAWRLVARNASGNSPCENNNEVYVWTGSGEVIPSHGHLLIGGGGYAGTTAADSAAGATFSDAASMRLEQDTVIIDAVCFYFDQTSQDHLTTCSIAYACEGAPITNPHDGTNGTNTDDSLERKPGGNGGNATDTGDSSADFQAIAPSVPQNLASAPTP